MVTDQRIHWAIQSAYADVHPAFGLVRTEINTGLPFIFDASAYYGHNEMELGIWVAERHQLRAEIYREEYFLNMKPSEPADEKDDRIRLYSTKTNLAHSANFIDSPARQL